MKEQKKDNYDLIESLTHALKRYTKEKYFEDYEENTIIKDVIYFLGKCIAEKEYRMADGFKKFSKKVVKLLNE